jgi:hypothetical protein
MLMEPVMKNGNDPPAHAAEEVISDEKLIISKEWPNCCDQRTA